MRERLLVLFGSVVAFGLVIIAVVDLFALGSGTCGALADQLWFNCWGTRLLRSLTGWSTNIAAALVDCLLAALSLAFAFAIARQGFEEPIEAQTRSKSYAWFLVPLALGAGGGILVRMNGATYWESFAFGLAMFGLAGWRLGRDL